MHADERNFQRASYAFELPPELIAQEPAVERDQSRLMVVEPRLLADDHTAPAPAVVHASFRDLPRWLDAKTLLVINDSAVRPARLYARRAHGGRVELLLLSLTGDRGTALLRANRRLREGEWLTVEGTAAAAKPGRVRVGPSLPEGGVRELHIPEGWLDETRLNELGVPPLPPYIERTSEDERLHSLDRLRYQTVYAQSRRTASGDLAFSAAAPTAGLHFTPALLDQCAAVCAGVVPLTLHVGLGTFRPVKTEDVREHPMHAERFELSADALCTLRKHLAAGGKLLAVGTTSARVLETLARLAWLPPRETATPSPEMPPLPAHVTQRGDGGLEGETALFLHPPDVPRGFDGLITNFHLPESTLVMLVAAMLGRECTLALYEQAVAARYRFFSYGDAMLIRPR